MHIFNSFIQPNDSTLVAYGSGDANWDNGIDLEDYNTIYLMLGKKTTEDSREFDRADVDGDGIITIADGEILKEYLDGIRKYLPGHWNKLQTRQERESWFDKCLKIDWTSNIPYNYPNWVCYDYEFQTFINFTGLNINEQNSTFPKKYSLKDNCRFNLPILCVGINSPNELGHAIIGAVVGDNSSKWEDWKLKEPQNDKDVNIGYNLMPNNSQVLLHYITRLSTERNIAILLLNFLIDSNGNPSLIYPNPNLVLTRPTSTSVKDDKNKPVFPWVKQNYPNPFNFSTTIEYSVPKLGRVSLEVFNIQGQKLETLVNNELQESGKHRASFNSGRNASGLYFYKLQAEDKDNKPYTETKKMIIEK